MSLPLDSAPAEVLNFVIFFMTKFGTQWGPKVLLNLGRAPHFMQGTKKNGFTLIELLLVVAIIGMLATIAVPSLSGSRDSAESAAAVAHLRTIHTNQAMYRISRGRYARLAELNTFVDGALGRTVSTTLRRGEFVYLMFPDPSDSSLAQGYDLHAYRLRAGRLISHYRMSDEGMIETIIR